MRHGSESENELLFLRERWYELQKDLTQTNRRIQDARRMGHPSRLLEARREHLQREQAIIDELFDETAFMGLEEAIGRWLRKLQNAQFALSPAGEYRHYYAQPYWDREIDRTILNDLLQDWQAWKRTMAHPDDDYW